jgi:hypothetical protein
MRLAPFHPPHKRPNRLGHGLRRDFCYGFRLAHKQVTEMVTESL